MPIQQRRPNRNKFLDASIDHLEKALLARAEFLTHRAGERNTINQALILENGPDLDSIVDVRIADEFRALAEEMHFW